MAQNTLLGFPAHTLPYRCGKFTTLSTVSEDTKMLRLSPFITVYCCAVAALLGACTGSFLACLAWRTVHGESVLRGRSHCDVCGHVLGVRDLVPVFSYLLSGGKCRYCGAKLSARHVWGELISAAVFVSLLLQYDISLQTLEAWLLACVLLACAFADLEGPTGWPRPAVFRQGPTRSPPRRPGPDTAGSLSSRKRAPSETAA